MSRKQYRVVLVKGNNQKSVMLYATSRENASYEALRQNQGWTVKDVQG